MDHVDCGASTIDHNNIYVAVAEDSYYIYMLFMSAVAMCSYFNRIYKSTVYLSLDFILLNIVQDRKMKIETATQYIIYNLSQFEN